jgi:small subunit ribosomal protein S9
MEKKKKITEFLGTGRRKTSVAAVRLRPGKGQIKINGRDAAQYFPSADQREILLAPLKMMALEGQYDILVNVKGGGPTGQLEATRLGVARAMVTEDVERRQSLKDAGYLTRDPRRRERKKFGLAGARKAFQFSKR